MTDPNGAPMNGMNDGRWIKSSYTETNCVEVNIGQGGVAMRDSKHPTGPVLTFTLGEWQAFLSGAKDGEFDLPR
jgi:hypothetical protein